MAQPQTQAICRCFRGAKVRAIGAVSLSSAKICCADHKKKITAAQPGVVSAVQLHRHPRCARTLRTPSLQALTGKRVVASLLGHSRLVALCSLAFSQEVQ